MNSMAAPFNAERALSLAGILCVLLAMVLGYIYASYISHVANAGIKEAWSSIMVAVSQGDVALVRQYFAEIADLTDKRGRIMNSHSHLGGSGLLVLAIAALQPLSALSGRIKLRLGYAMILGVVFQFAGVLLSYYLDSDYIYLSDIGAILLLMGVAGTLFGLVVARKETVQPSVSDFIYFRLQSGSSRLLIKAGISLILILMLLGIYLAWLMVSGDEAGSLASVARSVEKLMQNDVLAAQSAIATFKALQTKMAINAAAHSHGIEMAILMLLLALLREGISIGESAFKLWCIVFIAISCVFPLWIFLAINYSFVFAKFANLSGAALAILLLVVAFGFISNKAESAVSSN